MMAMDRLLSVLELRMQTRVVRSTNDAASMGVEDRRNAVDAAVGTVAETFHRMG
jgi:hypothetical protein